MSVSYFDRGPLGEQGIRAEAERRKNAAHRLIIKKHGELLSKHPGASLALEEGSRLLTEDEGAELLVCGMSLVWVARNPDSEVVGKQICYAGQVRA